MALRIGWWRARGALGAVVLSRAGGGARLQANKGGGAGPGAADAGRCREPSAEWRLQCALCGESGAPGAGTAGRFQAYLFPI